MSEGPSPMKLPPKGFKISTNPVAWYKRWYVWVGLFLVISVAVAYL